ncbi:uncharacterized protein [Apostichopus japonicus]|uniref:uncharacterized protein n=1 Tax=Stichopus japonicus TaxID=307972 RepID=UPI003AB8C604
MDSLPVDLDYAVTKTKIQLKLQKCRVALHHFPQRKYGRKQVQTGCSVLTTGLGRDMLLSNLPAALELPTTQRQRGLPVPGKGVHTWRSSCRLLEHEVDGQI